jgi:hypothetical protein
MSLEPSNRPVTLPIFINMREIIDRVHRPAQGTETQGAAADRFRPRKGEKPEN